MSKTTNRYAKQQKKKAFLNGITTTLDTQHDFKNSALETGKDLLIGVLGGGILGAAIGKMSFFTGILVSGTGYYFNNRLISNLGFGMMASSGLKLGDSVSGLDGEMDGIEGAKQRVLAFTDSFTEKTFLNKIIKRNSAVNGLGEVQYFVYPQNGVGDLDMSDLDRIENQLIESGNEYSQHLSGNGFGDFADMGDIGEVGEIGSLDAISINY